MLTCEAKALHLWTSAWKHSPENNGSECHGKSWFQSCLPWLSLIFWCVYYSWMSFASSLWSPPPPVLVPVPRLTLNRRRHLCFSKWTKKKRWKGPKVHIIQATVQEILKLSDWKAPKYAAPKRQKTCGSLRFGRLSSEDPNVAPSFGNVNTTFWMKKKKNGEWKTHDIDSTAQDSSLKPAAFKFQGTKFRFQSTSVMDLRSITHCATKSAADVFTVAMIKLFLEQET